MSAGFVKVMDRFSGFFCEILECSFIPWHNNELYQRILITSVALLESFACIDDGSVQWSVVTGHWFMVPSKTKLAWICHIASRTLL